MRIIVVGASGTIGRAVVAALEAQHEVIAASRLSLTAPVDIEKPASIREMYRRTGKVDAVVSVAGQAKFAPLAELADSDFQFSLENKLMGQVNLVRLGFEWVRDGGSFTLTSGVLAQSPMRGSAAISLVNSGLEGFTRAAALEAPRGIRVNVVSPPWVSETLAAMGMDTAHGLPAASVARAYVGSVTGSQTGAVIAPER
jgi:NAD(P)-dependent dehydrogenase (short-subunit alcohol dehydrogenase family)